MLNIQFILTYFHFVFNNEWNNRKILHSFVDTTWGSYVMMSYVCGSQANFDLNCYGNRGREIYDEKCKRYKNLKRTLVLTKDNNGNIELFQFWQDFTQGHWCYSEIKTFTELSKEHRESCNAVKKYFV
jgi:hypothetical protein